MPVGINPDMDYLLDPQQARPVGICPCCGRELFSVFAETCWFCQMDAEVENE